MSEGEETSKSGMMMDVDEEQPSSMNPMENEDVEMKDQSSSESSEASSSSGESDLEELDEDDLDLLEQSNMRKQAGTFRNLQRRVMSDEEKDESAESEGEDVSEDEEIGMKRKAALDRLFEDSDEEEDKKVPASKDVSDEDSLSDFIEDDLGGGEEEEAEEAKQKAKAARKQALAANRARFGAGSALPKDVLQDMLDIFGDGTEYLDAVDEDSMDVDEGDSAAVKKPKKKAVQKEASVEDVIRATDMPERYQALAMASYADEPKGELQRETQWITGLLLPIVKERSPDATAERLAPVVASLLTLIREQGLEVPFIATHRKEYFQHLLGLNDLWRVLDWDEEWRAAARHRRAFVQLVERKHGPAVLERVNQILAEDMEAGLGEGLEVLGEYVRRVLGDQSRSKQNPLGEEGRNQLAAFVRAFCWDPKDFPLAWAMRDASKQPPEPAEGEPEALASAISGDFEGDSDRATQAATAFAAAELAFHPKTSRMFRGALQASGTISVTPTERGLREIGMAHELAPWKHLDAKPIASITDDLYLRLLRAQKEGLIVLSVGFGGKESFDLIADWLHYYRGSRAKSAWGELRERVFQEALQSHVLPRMRKQLHAHLEREGQAFVGQCCQYALQSKLMQAPFGGGDVLALSWADGSPEEATMAVLLDPEGRVLDQGKFAHLRHRKSPAEWDRLAQWIRERKPALLVVGGTSTATEELYRGLRDLARDLPETRVIYGDDDTARVYPRSARAAAEFPEYGAGLRYCVSLGRRWLCPLYELAALTPAEAATRLALHPSQALVPPEALARWIARAFVNVVNLVGIEVGRAVASPWVRSALKYVAGLGPLKAEALCQALAKVRLDRIVDLTEQAILPPLVYANCASFLKITSSPTEPLDQTRIHPENYVLARKIACDALEVSLEEAEDQEATARSSVLQVMKRPERLNDLLLDEYARELERRLHIPKHLTLLDIKAELQAPYADLRSAVHEAPPEVVFEALTGETERTLFVGQHVHARVTRLSDRSAYCRLESGLSGHLALRRMPVLSASGRSPSHPKQALRPHQTIEAAIVGIDLARFEVELSMLPEDLREPRRPLAGDFDPHYSHEAAKEASRSARRGFSDAAQQPSQRDQQQQQQQQQSAPVRRLISHPSYREIGRAEAEALLHASMLGEVVVRPSGSRGSDHLALTWKIDASADASGEALFQHIDIEERDRPTDYSLGRRLLIKGADGHTLVYEDLDEIIARHIEPLAAYLADARRCPKYVPVPTVDPPAARAFIEGHLERERARTPSRIAYCLSMSRDRPGAILLSYQPASRPHHELVDVTPAGFKFRGKPFDSLESLINWFKHNYARKQQ